MEMNIDLINKIEILSEQEKKKYFLKSLKNNDYKVIKYFLNSSFIYNLDFYNDEFLEILEKKEYNDENDFFIELEEELKEYLENVYNEELMDLLVKKGFFDYSGLKKDDFDFIKYKGFENSLKRGYSKIAKEYIDNFSNDVEVNNYIFNSFIRLYDNHKNKYPFLDELNNKLFVHSIKNKNTMYFVNFLSKNYSLNFEVYGKSGIQLIEENKTFLYKHIGFFLNYIINIDDEKFVKNFYKFIGKEEINMTKNMVKKLSNYVKMGNMGKFLQYIFDKRIIGSFYNSLNNINDNVSFIKTLIDYRLDFELFDTNKISELSDENKKDLREYAKGYNYDIPSLDIMYDHGLALENEFRLYVKHKDDDTNIYHELKLNDKYIIYDENMIEETINIEFKENEKEIVKEIIKDISINSDKIANTKEINEHIFNKINTNNILKNKKISNEFSNKIKNYLDQIYPKLSLKKKNNVIANRLFLLR